MLTKREMFIINQEVIDDVKEELEFLGCELVHIVKHSQHEDDSFLYDIIAYSRVLDNFITWLYNGRGLNNGHYDIDNLKEAYEDLANRMWG